ncbi:hypothetical protein GCM10022244_41470 [Streptomyces gulbargensis]|uniref:TadE-like domain-containing protein n=1 Tax=Streptomyces gulbargensis TaxID=364901 RepID=A0ABP7MQC2_9ACTN
MRARLTARPDTTRVRADRPGRPRVPRHRGPGALPRARRAPGPGGRGSSWARVLGGPGPRPRARRRGDRGQAALEYLGFLPLLLLVGLAGLQLGIAAYAAQQAGTAARAAARAASMTDDENAPDPGTAGRAAVSGWVDPSIDPVPADGEVTVTATVRIPSVVPFWDGFGTVKKTATMPLPATPEERP